MAAFTKVPAETLQPGDVIRPPARELRLWMRRDAQRRGLTDDALWMTVLEVRAGASDTNGRPVAADRGAPRPSVG